MLSSADASLPNGRRNEGLCVLEKDSQEGLLGTQFINARNKSGQRKGNDQASPAGNSAGRWIDSLVLNPCHPTKCEESVCSSCIQSSSMLSSGSTCNSPCGTVRLRHHSSAAQFRSFSYGFSFSVFAPNTCIMKLVLGRKWTVHPGSPMLCSIGILPKRFGGTSSKSLGLPLHQPHHQDFKIGCFVE